MFELAREINRVRNEHLRRPLGLPGLETPRRPSWGFCKMTRCVSTKRCRLQAVGLGNEEIETLIDARNAARKAQGLCGGGPYPRRASAHAITLEDGPEGTTWRTRSRAGSRRRRVDGLRCRAYYPGASRRGPRFRASTDRGMAQSGSAPALGAGMSGVQIPLPRPTSVARIARAPAGQYKRP